MSITMPPQDVFQYDTHIHSHHSDGDFAPGEVARQAKESGLRGAILTDHNTIEGYEEFSAACRRYRLETWMGVEISTQYLGLEIHVLGYARQFDLSIMRAGLQPIITGYNIRSQKMVDLLRQRGETKITFEQIRAQKVARDPITKYDIAQAVRQERGAPLTVQLELQQLLNSGGPAHVPYGDDIFDPAEACRLITRAGGVSVLAHPGQYVHKYKGTPDQARSMILELLDKLQEAGLCGIEYRSSVHTQETVQYFSEVAAARRLLMLGASDWHGGIHHPKRIFGAVGSSEEEFHQLAALIGRK